MWELASYSFIGGVTGTPPAQWPEGSALVRSRNNFTAVVALHPECPCSQATLEELDSVVAQSGGRLQARLLFVEQSGLAPVEESSLWQRARRIAGVHAIRDVDGAEARLFGTRTSGEIRLYAPDGRLLFQGGITASRGHVGDNPGHAAVVSFLNHRAHGDTPVTTPVFGCALWNENIAAAP